MKALVSLHDLMPETLPACESVLHHLRERGLPPVPLLVVPGRAWTGAQINRLQELASAGHELVAHGWLHHTRPRRVFHRLHACLISRNVAEHLDLDSAGILALLQRSQAWFAAQGLPVPETYVPPAWALGAIRTADLAAAPFRRIEVTRGLLRIGRAPSLRPLPLTGYEADSPFRALALGLWNQGQWHRARRSGRPLRLSIHPQDLGLRLKDQLDAHLEGLDCLPNYAALDD